MWSFEASQFRSGRNALKLSIHPEMWYRVAAIGTPGIGKTTATPILIRMLLKQGKTVVYLFRSVKEDRLVLRICSWSQQFNCDQRLPRENESMMIFQASELTPPTTLLIQARQRITATLQVTFEPKVILVPSPDSGHWGGTEFTKARDSVCRHFQVLATMVIRRTPFCSANYCAQP